jgi:hypothetical protein
VPQAADEIGEGSANLSSAVFLHKVNTLNRHFSLVRPAPAKFALAAMIERTGFTCKYSSVFGLELAENPNR